LQAQKHRQGGGRFWIEARGRRKAEKKGQISSPPLGSFKITPPIARENANAQCAIFLLERVVDKQIT